MVQHDFKMKLISTIEMMMTSSILFLHLVSAVAVPCKNPVLNLDMDKMLQGVDITTVDQFPVIHPTNHTPKANILGLTCNDGRTWTDPLSNKTYEYPDQIQHLQTTGFERGRVVLLKTNDIIKLTLAREVGAYDYYQPFVSISTASYKQLQKDIDNKSKLVVDSTVRFQDVDILFDKLQLSIDAQSYINNNLTGPLESNIDAYLHFVDTFGTHYRQDGIFGGAVKKYMKINESYSSLITDAQTELYAKLHFTNDMGETPNQKVPLMFKSNLKEEVFYYGGVDKFKTPKDIQKWRLSTKENRWFYSTKLSPIYELIKNETTKKEIKKAIDLYLVKKVASPYFKNYKIYKKVPKELITKMIIKFITNHEVHKLSDFDLVVKRYLDNELNIADWFKNRARLCLTMRGDSCNTKSECAQYNYRLGAYYENAGKNKPCRTTLRIGISGKIPKYFQDTKICMRYKSIGHAYCNEEVAPAGKIKCASVNKNVNYVDHPQNKHGTCKLSWMIQVPDDAPVWLKTIKICFHWGKQNKSEYCSGKKPPNCMSAGKWTEDYEDSTRGVSEKGCYISFGWRTLDHERIQSVSG